MREKWRKKRMRRLKRRRRKMRAKNKYYKIKINEIIDKY